MNFGDFKQLAMNLERNPQQYNWPLKTCKSAQNIFPGSNWSVMVMQIEQSKVYDKVQITKFCVFLTKWWV